MINHDNFIIYYCFIIDHTGSHAPPNAHNLQMRQLPCQYTYGQTRIHANTPINMTPLLALYCHLNNLIANTVLLSTQTIIVPICLQSINQTTVALICLQPE